MRKPKEAGIQLSRAGANGAVGPGKVTWQGKASAVLKPRHGGLSGKVTSGFALGSENPGTLRHPSPARRVHLLLSPPSPLRILRQLRFQSR